MGFFIPDKQCNENSPKILNNHMLMQIKSDFMLVLFSEISPH